MRAIGDHQVQALAAGGLPPTVQALGLQQFAQPERNLGRPRVTSGTLS